MEPGVKAKEAIEELAMTVLSPWQSKFSTVNSNFQMEVGSCQVAQEKTHRQVEVMLGMPILTIVTKP